MTQGESVAVGLARLEQKLDTVSVCVTGLEGRMRNLERAAWTALGLCTALGAATGGVASILGGG
jgi:hypothetical protein